MEILIKVYINSNKNKKNHITSNKNLFHELSRNAQINNNNFTFMKNNNLAKFNYKTQLLSTNRKLNTNSISNKFEKEQKNDI